jgi:hypothetical protein
MGIKELLAYSGVIISDTIKRNYRQSWNENINVQRESDQESN